jgi:predicted HTH domain antitoxin
MSEVVSFRFREHELNHINKLSGEKKVDKTTAARELIEYGWTHYIIQQYKEGRISFGKTAKELHISLSELIDLLADIGIKNPLKKEDYFEGLRNI